jgi:hypothetical protein
MEFKVRIDIVGKFSRHGSAMSGGRGNLPASNAEDLVSVAGVSQPFDADFNSATLTLESGHSTHSIPFD